MKNETFFAHLSPEVTPNELTLLHNREWDELLKKSHLIGQQNREKHARRLGRSATAIFGLLLDDDDLGGSRTEVAYYGDDSKRDYKTFSVPNLGAIGAKNYFHIVSHLDHEDKNRYLAYELFVTDSRNIKLPSDSTPSVNPNYNKASKIAGLWVGDPQSSEPDAVATLHDTHETLFNLLDVADIEPPESYYYGFQRGLKPKTRGRHR